MAGTTSDPSDPRLTHGVDGSPVEQAPVYLVLSAADREAGRVRPLRLSYKHLGCGVVTVMSQAIAETYATRPDFYGSTYCVGCRQHLPVGADGEFVWDGTDEKVGT